MVRKVWIKCANKWQVHLHISYNLPCHCTFRIMFSSVEGDDISAMTPLDTALDSGNPCSSRDVADGHTRPVHDAGV